MLMILGHKKTRQPGQWDFAIPCKHFQAYCRDLPMKNLVIKPTISTTICPELEIIFCINALNMKVVSSRALHHPHWQRYLLFKLFSSFLKICISHFDMVRYLKNLNQIMNQYREKCSFACIICNNILFMDMGGLWWLWSCVKLFLVPVVQAQTAAHTENRYFWFSTSGNFSALSKTAQWRIHYIDFLAMSWSYHPSCLLNCGEQLVGLGQIHTIKFNKNRRAQWKNDSNLYIGDD